MIAPDALILLDTSVLLPWFRADASGRWIEKTYQLKRRSDRPLISVITVGEILAFSIRWNYNDDKRNRLDALLREFVIVSIRGPVARRFAEIQVQSQKIGKPIGENDTWIAATALVTGAILLTADHDFDKLTPGLIRLEVIDPPRRP